MEYRITCMILPRITCMILPPPRFASYATLADFRTEAKTSLTLCWLILFPAVHCSAKRVAWGYMAHEGGAAQRAHFDVDVTGGYRSRRSSEESVGGEPLGLYDTPERRKQQKGSLFARSRQAGKAARQATRKSIRHMRNSGVAERNSAVVDSIVIGTESRKTMASIDLHVDQHEMEVDKKGMTFSRKGVPWFLVNPNATTMAVWDTLTFTTLIFISFFTPLEVAFMAAPTSVAAPLFILGRVIDLVFIFDMLLQFVLMVPKESDQSKFETSWRTIVYLYLHPLKGWFTLDLVSLAASSFDVVPLIVKSMKETTSEVREGSSDSGESALALFRIVRILRLVKLARLLKASQRLKEWSVKIATPRATLTVFQTSVECFYVTHWSACALGLLTILPESQLDSWVATLGYCKPLEHLDVVNEAGATVRGFECVGWENIYMQSLWWSAGLLMGAPISLLPHKGPFQRHYSLSHGETLLSLYEQSAVLALKTFSAFLWVTVLAKIVNVYNSLDPDASEFNAGWDALNRFVSYFKVPKVDALELRRYYVERADMAKAKSRKRVMNDFSPVNAHPLLASPPT